MNDTRFLPDAVQWSEGMLLSPQHFQQHDIHTQALVQQRVAGLSPHCWGVRNMKIDTVRLPAGEISILDFEGVMPDGLPVIFSVEDGRAPKSINVSALCQADGRPVKVWLAVPPRTGAMAVPSTSIKRYENVRGQETIDEVTGIGDVVVERQRARVELYAGDQLPSGYPALCVMEVAAADGDVVLTRCHPPMLRLSASAFLGTQGLLQRFASLRERLWMKMRELAGSAIGDDDELPVPGGAEARQHLMMAREIGACLPLADAVLADPNSAPQAAYHAVAQIVGRMAAIGGNPRPLLMDPYSHADCIAQFEAALDFIDRRLGLIDTHRDSMLFARVGEGTFARRLPEDAGSTVYIELRTREGQTAQAVHDWMGDTRIASEDLMPVLRQRRLAGARARPLGAHEAGRLGLRPDAIAYELHSLKVELQQGLVEAFTAGRSVLVQGNAHGAPAAIILHHMRPTKTTMKSSEAVHA